VLEMLDADSVRAWALAAADALEACRTQIDELNVYPVPDSDTGTNLAVTIRAGATAAAQAGGGLADVLNSFASGAAIAAQGSSGMIASQLLRGLADDLIGVTNCAGQDLARALGRASNIAYASVREPHEGTILSVARAAASAASDSEPSLGSVVAAAVAGAAAALARTPGQLAVLARAGVVDAGGQGLVVVLDALACVVTGLPSTLELQRAPDNANRFEAIREGGSKTFAYEVQYLLEAPAEAIAPFEAVVSDLGDTFVIAAVSAGVWNVHVHVNDVGAAIEAGVVAGRPHRIRVTRFADQIAAERGKAAVRSQSATDSQSAPLPAVAIVVLLSDPGLAQLFEAEGVVVIVIDHTAGADPATSSGNGLSTGSVASTGSVVSPGSVVSDAALAVLRAHSGRRIVLLPDHERLVPIAARIAGQARTDGIDVSLIPTRSPMQGLAAVAVHDPQRRGDDDVIAMAEAAAATRFGEIAIATEPALTTIGECRAGDVLGLIDGDVVEIAASIPAAITALLSRLFGVGAELVTAIVGPTAPESSEALIRDCIAEHAPLVDLVIYPVGQLERVLLLGAE
jgi:uncharacterized protein